MVLEFRDKNGILFNKVLGGLALHQYSVLERSRFFKKETKIFNDKGSFTCLVCTENCKINMTSEFEIWFEPNDYIKIVP